MMMYLVQQKWNLALHQGFRLALLLVHLLERLYEALCPPLVLGLVHARVALPLLLGHPSGQRG